MLRKQRSKLIKIKNILNAFSNYFHSKPKYLDTYKAKIEVNFIFMKNLDIEKTIELFTDIYKEVFPENYNFIGNILKSIKALLEGKFKEIEDEFFILLDIPIQ